MGAHNELKEHEPVPVPHCRLIVTDWKRRFALMGVVEDAVGCELVSKPNSLLTGKLTGNFAESGHPPRFSCLINARIQ
jgi:hypothetical protein